MVGSWELQELHPLLLPKDMKGMFVPVVNDRQTFSTSCLAPLNAPYLPILNPVQKAPF